MWMTDTSGNSARQWHSNTAFFHLRLYGLVAFWLEQARFHLRHYLHKLRQDRGAMDDSWQPSFSAETESNQAECAYAMETPVDRYRNNGTEEPPSYRRECHASCAVGSVSTKAELAVTPPRHQSSFSFRFSSPRSRAFGVSAVLLNGCRYELRCASVFFETAVCVHPCAEDQIFRE